MDVVIIMSLCHHRHIINDIHIMQVCTMLQMHWVQSDMFNRKILNLFLNIFSIMSGAHN